MRSVGILGLAILVGFVGQAVGQSTSSEVKPAAGAQLAADTLMMTTSGATFMAPLGWRVTSNANKVLLAPPEEDSRLVLIDVQAPDAATAIAAGWASYDPMQIGHCG